MCSGCGPMHAGAAVGLCPDGIGGIFTAASGAVPWGRDALALGRKRGLMRLVLRHGATCMPGYFVGTLQLYTISHDRFGILAALSRRLRLSLFLFHGRFGLPPSRGAALSPRSSPSSLRPPARSPSRRPSRSRRTTPASMAHSPRRTTRPNLPWDCRRRPCSRSAEENGLCGFFL